MKAPAAATGGSGPRREDHGNLIVLHLYGQYRDMGRQHVELLGPLARDVYDLQRGDWGRLISSLGLAGRIADTALPPFWSGLWSRWEGSGLYTEINGMADAFGVSGGDAWRGVFGVLGSGTSTLVATGSATADGSAIVAKNSDWTDSYGLRRPIVIHYNPVNGDLPHVMASWPLLNCPVVGVNSAGFAIGINFFMADQVLGVGPTQWPWRRALQKATSVRDGIRIFRGARNRGISGFFSMADADGDITLLEVSPMVMSVARPREHWFAQSNHARTRKMLPHDRGGSPDSEQRRAAMEAAAQPNLGKITPQIAAEILRDRSNSPYVNESQVANTGVLNSTVVHPATRTLWHSTAKQPQAPFGEMLPFSPGGTPLTAAPIPADPRFDTEEMRREAAIIEDIRRAVRLFDEGQLTEAGAIWDRLADQDERTLQPHRITWARARVRLARTTWDQADSLLTSLDSDEAPFEIRAHAFVARAWVADRTGRRDDALRLYRQALAYLDRFSRYNHQFTISPMRKWIADGLKAPQAGGRLPALPHLQRVP